MSFKSTAHQSALTDIEENFLKAFVDHVDTGKRIIESDVEKQYPNITED
jgi:hypothetical protein